MRPLWKVLSALQMLVPLSETVPERLRQVPFTEKQPAPILIPLPLKVDVAFDAMLSAPAMVVEALTKRLPPMYALPVVVAPPLMVRPPFANPLPIVEEARETMPPWRTERPVVVAPPLMVRPPFCAPFPIVDEPSRRAKLPAPPLIPPLRLKLLIVPALMVLVFSVVEVAVPK